MKPTLSLMAFVTALASCAADSHGGDESDSIEPPAERDIFLDQNGDGMIGDPRLEGGSQVTIYLFNDTRLLELCLRPDADSFDDYEEVGSDGTVLIPRGTTPLSTECPADGIVTGPMHEELFPSSWCRIENCGTHVGDEGSEGGGY